MNIFVKLVLCAYGSYIRMETNIRSYDIASKLRGTSDYQCSIVDAATQQI